jgi:hypothetical protein
MPFPRKGSSHHTEVTFYAKKHGCSFAEAYSHISRGSTTTTKHTSKKKKKQGSSSKKKKRPSIKKNDTIPDSTFPSSLPEDLIALLNHSGIESMDDLNILFQEAHNDQAQFDNLLRWRVPFLNTMFRQLVASKLRKYREQFA